MWKNLVISCAFVALFLGGCGPQRPEPYVDCPSAGLASVSLAKLQAQSAGAMMIYATGDCRLVFYRKGKPHPEEVDIRLWFNPPDEICIQGDIALLSNAIVLGSNSDEFWLVIKPKQISRYYWGTWAENPNVDELPVSPRLILDAFGLFEAQGPNDRGAWSLETSGRQDVLTLRDEDGMAVKSLHIDRCDYFVRKVDYYSDGRTTVTMELDKYRKVSEEFSVPGRIKMIRNRADGKEESAMITLGSAKPKPLGDKARDKLFNRRELREIRNEYMVIDGRPIKMVR
jgi:hypothetical protein